MMAQPCMTVLHVLELSLDRVILHVGIYCVRARGSPWITSELKKRMHNPINWMQFKRQRNVLTNEIRLAKQSYDHNSSNEYKVNSRKTSQTTNKLT